MNGFLCIKSKNTQSEFDDVCADDPFSSWERNDYESRDTNISIYSPTNNSKLQGSSENDSYILHFSGVLQFPIQDWDGTAPSDSAELSAGYLLKRFSKHSNQFLNDVYGQFALVLLNKITGELFVATDGSGYRRVFEIAVSDVYAVSTHLKLLSYFTKRNQLNKSDLAFCLSYEFLPDNKTIYPNVRSIPKEKLVQHKDRSNYIVKQYTKIDAVDSSWALNEDIVIDKLHHEFIDAISRQVPSENKIAVLLGGFDSAVIASTLAAMGKQVETFSFCFDDESYNQKYTDNLSNYLNIKHNWVKIDSHVIKLGIEKYSSVFNQPSSLAHYHIQTNYVLEIVAARGYKYCFTGDGCDELFLGYPTIYRRARLFRKIGVFPGFLVRFIRYFLARSTVEDVLGHTSRLMRNIALVLGRRMPMRGFVANRIFDEYSLSRLIPGWDLEIESNVESNLQEVAENYGSINEIRLAFAGKSIVSATKNKLEGSSLNTGIVIQSPFFDEQFKRIVSTIPECYYRPENKEKQRSIGKYAFVEMALRYKLLPEEIILQEKASPVTSMVDYWYMNELRDEVLNCAMNFPFKINRNYVLSLLRYKKAEDYLRKKMLGRYVMHLVSMLVTYSCYFKK